MGIWLASSVPVGFVCVAGGTGEAVCLAASGAFKSSIYAGNTRGVTIDAPGASKNALVSAQRPVSTQTLELSIFQNDATRWNSIFQ